MGSFELFLWDKRELWRSSANTLYRKKKGFWGVSQEWFQVISGFPSGVGSFCCLTWFLVLFLSLILWIPLLWLIARVLCCRECRLCCTGGLLFILEFLAMHHPGGVKCFWEETIDWGAETEAGSATLWQPVYTLKRSSAKTWDYLESES